MYSQILAHIESNTIYIESLKSIIGGQVLKGIIGQKNRWRTDSEVLSAINNREFPLGVLKVSLKKRIREDEYLIVS